MSGLTKAQAFTSLRDKLTNYLNEQDIKVPDEFALVGDDELKTFLALRVKPYLDDMDQLENNLLNLYQVPDIGEEQKAMLKRYITAMCKCV